MSNYFNNQLLVQPQTAVAVVDTSLQPTPISGPLVAVGVLGYSTEGAPNLPVLLTSADQAVQTFGQGPLVDGIRRVFSPSPSSPGAQQVYGIRVNPATQSTATLLDANSITTIALTTRDYGIYTRSLNVQVKAATNAGASPVPGNARMVLVGNGPQVVTGDNLGYNVLTVTSQVSGNQVGVEKWSGTVQTAATGGQTTLVVTTATAGMSVSQIVAGQSFVVDTAGVQETVTATSVAVAGGNATLTLATALVNPHAIGATVVATAPSLLLSGAASKDNTGYPLSNYANLAALAAAATASSTNWAVTVPPNMNQVQGTATPVSSASSPLILDLQAPVTIGSVGGSTTLAGVTQAMTDWLNGNAQPYFTAVRQSGTLVPATMANAVFATGGADDAAGGSLLANTLTIVTNDWQNSVNALQGVDTPLFVLMSGDKSIHLIGDNHAALMNTTGKAERIQIAGGVQGESTAQAVTRAQNLNSDNTALVYPGIQDYDQNGLLQTYDCYYAAATIAGLAAGAGEPNALTGQQVRIQGLEQRTQANGGAYTQADYDTLLQGGVMPLKYRKGVGYIVVQSITTWLQDAKYTKRELSTRRIVLRIVRAVREELDADDIGKNVSPSFLNDVVANTTAVLDFYTAQGYLVGDSTNPSYQGVTATVQPGRPDSVLVSFQASPAIPGNYILVTAHLTAYGTTPTS